MKRTSSLWLSMLLCSVALLFLSRSAQARPEYARKEGKACQYCHVSSNPNAGSTDRNTRGRYYGSHNHSFAGYKGDAGKGEPLKFTLDWSINLSDLPRRVAVGDITGDGTPRLIMLHEVPTNRYTTILSVQKWDGKDFNVEFQEEVLSSPDRIAVGKFAGADKPAVVVTSEALWKWENTKLVRVGAKQKLSMLGTYRFKNGDERLLIAKSPTNITAYRVDPNAPEGQWLIEGIPMPTTLDDLRLQSLYARKEFLEAMQMNPSLAEGGITGTWDPLNNGKKVIYYVQGGHGENSNPGQMVYSMNLINTRDTPLWESPKEEVPPIDIAFENPRDGKSGLLILQREAHPHTPRRLSFYALDTTVKKDTKDTSPQK